MNTSSLDLRAAQAMRAEDLRIASKHREQAAARVMSPANRRAYERALAWEATCHEAFRLAQVAVLAA